MRRQEHAMSSADDTSRTEGHDHLGNVLKTSFVLGPIYHGDNSTVLLGGTLSDATACPHLTHHIKLVDIR